MCPRAGPPAEPVEEDDPPEASLDAVGLMANGPEERGEAGERESERRLR